MVFQSWGSRMHYKSRQAHSPSIQILSLWTTSHYCIQGATSCSHIKECKLLSQCYQTILDQTFIIYRIPLFRLRDKKAGTPLKTNRIHHLQSSHEGSLKKELRAWIHITQV